MSHLLSPNLILRKQLFPCLSGWALGPMFSFYPNFMETGLVIFPWLPG